MKTTLTLDDMYGYQENLKRRSHQEGQKAGKKRRRSRRDALQNKVGEYVELTGVFKLMSNGKYVFKKLTTEDGEKIDHLTIGKEQFTNIDQTKKLFIKTNTPVKLTGVVDPYWHRIDGQLFIQYQLINLKIEFI